VPFTVVSNKDSGFAPKKHYSIGQKIEIWFAVCSEHEWYLANYGARRGRDSFSDFIYDKIIDAVESGWSVRSPNGEQNNIEALAISSRTLSNVLAADRTAIAGLTLRTCQYLDVFLNCKDQIQDSKERRNMDLASDHLSSFFTPGEITSTGRAIEQSEKEMVYEIANASEMVISPKRANSVYLAVRRGALESNNSVRLLSITSDLSTRKDVNSKNDLMEEQFFGFLLSTVDGDIAIMRGANTFAPLMVFLRDYGGSLAASIVSFDSPGYLLDYEKLVECEDIEILNFLQSTAWMM